MNIYTFSRTDDDDDKDDNGQPGMMWYFHIQYQDISYEKGTKGSMQSSLSLIQTPATRTNFQNKEYEVLIEHEMKLTNKMYTLYTFTFMHIHIYVYVLCIQCSCPMYFFVSKHFARMKR